MRIEKTVEEYSRYLSGKEKAPNIGTSFIDSLLLDFFHDLSFGLPDNFPKPNDGIDRRLVSVDLINGILPGEKFDVIIFTEVLEHMFQGDKIVLNSIRKVLTEDGILCFSVPKAVSIWARLRVIMGKNIWWTKHDIINGVYGGYGHLREYTFYKIKTLMEYDFNILLLKGINGYRKGLAKVANVLPNTFSNTILMIERRAGDDE